MAAHGQFQLLGGADSPRPIPLAPEISKVSADVALRRLREIKTTNRTRPKLKAYLLGSQSRRMEKDHFVNESQEI
jgi:hypothetical protein